MKRLALIVLLLLGCGKTETEWMLYPQRKQRECVLFLQAARSHADSLLVLTRDTEPGAGSPHRTCAYWVANFQ